MPTAQVCALTSARTAVYVTALLRLRLRYNRLFEANHAGQGFDSNNSTLAALSGAKTYFALHVRRGDFQFKDVKISAADIVKNLGGNALIPRGALVYVSTDDPKGVCEGMTYKRNPCPKGADAKGVPGCMEDCSWQAFTDVGWEVRFLGDFLARGALKDVNPNFYGESRYSCPNSK